MKKKKLPQLLYSFATATTLTFFPPKTHAIADTANFINDINDITISINDQIITAIIENPVPLREPTVVNINCIDDVIRTVSSAPYYEQKTYHFYPLSGTTNGNPISEAKTSLTYYPGLRDNLSTIGDIISKSNDRIFFEICIARGSIAPKKIIKREIARLVPHSEWHKQSQTPYTHHLFSVKGP